MKVDLANPSLNNIRCFIALISLLLSVQAIYFDDIINRDGIMYLQQAEAYLMGGLALAKTVYGWPFFSILIAKFHSLTGLNLELSALVINSFFFVLLTDTLLRISALTLKDKQMLNLAALFILGFTAINEYRDFIIRDIGYWAFCSLALFHFILFSAQCHYKHGLLWQILIFVAILFRVEGVIILCLLPLFHFYRNSFWRGLKQFLHSFSLLIIMGLISVLFFSHAEIRSEFNKLNDLAFYSQGQQHLDKLTASATALGSQILHYSDEYALLILVSGLLVMLAYELMMSFSFGYLLIYFLTKSATKTTLMTAENGHVKAILLYFFGVNLLILSAFVIVQYFVSSRYLGMALISLLLLALPTICNGLLILWQRKKILPLIIVIMAFIYCFGDQIVHSASKTYIKQTAIWAANNLPVDSRALTDDKFLMYYFNTNTPTASLCAGEISTGQGFLSSHSNNFLSQPCKIAKPFKISDFDYLLVVEKKKNHSYIDYIKTLDLDLIHQNKSRKGDMASVYRIRK